jgi:large subunit ribosomal protein L29
MKVSEIREMTQEDLHKEVKELKTELYRLRFQQATNNLDNPIKLRDVRRNIARVKTILRERELQG